jgi:hypothetical protein
VIWHCSRGWCYWYSRSCVLCCSVVIVDDTPVKVVEILVPGGYVKMTPRAPELGNQGVSSLTAEFGYRILCLFPLDNQNEELYLEVGAPTPGGICSQKAANVIALAWLDCVLARIAAFHCSTVQVPNTTVSTTAMIFRTHSPYCSAEFFSTRPLVKR